MVRAMARASDETHSGPDPLAAARDAAGAAGERLGSARAGAGERLGSARDRGRQAGRRGARDRRAGRARGRTHKLSQKPRLRGVSHQWAFFVSLGAGAALIFAASGAARRDRDVDLRLLALRDARHERPLPPRHLDAGGAALDAPPRPHDDLRLIAGTYTPFALLVMHGTLASVVLIVGLGHGGRRHRPQPGLDQRP